MDATFAVAAAMHGYNTSLAVDAAAARENPRVWDLTEHLDLVVASELVPA